MMPLLMRCAKCGERWPRWAFHKGLWCLACVEEHKEKVWDGIEKRGPA